MKRYLLHFTILLLVLVVTSCMFTGVENTGKITDKEVTRVINELEQRQPSSTLTAFVDSLSAWKRGKQFYATDDQLRLLFERSSQYDLDTIHFAGKFLSFDRYETVTSISGKPTVCLHFSDGINTFTYHTNKTMHDLPVPMSIPLLVDMDVVKHVADQLTGRQAYVKTPIWYDAKTEAMKKGRQYIPVKIIAVKPGNKVLPLRVEFQTTDQPEEIAFVWMSAPGAVMHNRDFDSVFSLANPKNGYPGISDTHWNLIINSEVCEDMTKEECRLALGAPKRISPVPDQAGMREYWYYDGGSYLYFVDGLLKKFRR